MDQQIRGPEPQPMLGGHSPLTSNREIFDKDQEKASLNSCAEHLRLRDSGLTPIECCREALCDSRAHLPGSLSL